MNRVIKFRAPIPKDSIAYMIMPDFCRDGCFYQDDQYLESFHRRANQFTFKSSGHSSYGAAQLMQFTGLTDVNGKEIYEGDIVNFSFDGVLHIESGNYIKFEDGAFLIHKPYFCPLASDANFIEVIGNIYEHSHLLNRPPNPEGSDTTEGASNSTAD